MCVCVSVLVHRWKGKPIDEPEGKRSVKGEEMREVRAERSRHQAPQRHGVCFWSTVLGSRLAFRPTPVCIHTGTIYHNPSVSASTPIPSLRFWTIFYGKIKRRIVGKALESSTNWGEANSFTLSASSARDPRPREFTKLCPDLQERSEHWGSKSCPSKLLLASCKN